MPSVTCLSRAITPISTFCILEKDADWGKAKPTWGTKRDVREMEMYMDKVKEHFTDKGVPVIIGEYGCVAVKNKTKDQIRLFNLLATEEMISRKICPVLWARALKTSFSRRQPRLRKTNPPRLKTPRNNASKRLVQKYRALFLRFCIVFCAGVWYNEKAVCHTVLSLLENRRK